MFVWNVNPESAIKNNIFCNETMLVLWVFCVTCAVWVKGTGLNCVARDTEATGRPSVCVCDTLISCLLECPCAGELVWKRSIANFHFLKVRFGERVRCFFGWDSVVFWPTEASCVVWGVSEQRRSRICCQKSLLSWMRRCWFCGFSVCSLCEGHWTETCCKWCWSYSLV